MRRIVTAGLLTAWTGLGCTGAKSYLDSQLPPPTATSSSAPRLNARQLPDNGFGPIVQAGAEVAAPVTAVPSSVDDFVQLAVMQNPRIARATIAIDAAHGHYVQAGLYPNPDLAVTWDEIGDRTAAGGILTAPKVTQTIVTGKKLQLSQAVAAKGVDQAMLDLLGERYAVVGAVRADFFDTLVLQERVKLLTEIEKLADDVVKSGQTLLDNKLIARLDLLQLEVDRERFRAERKAAARELPAAYRRLAATAGNSSTPVASVRGSLDDLPEYDLEQVRQVVSAAHPEVRSAKVAVEKAQAAVRRAEAEPIPDVAVYGAFIRQYENRSYDGAAGVSLTLPVWNKNQGNIRAARAELGMAVQNVGRVENDLTARVATAFQTYAAARERAELFRLEIIPRAEETFRLSQEAFKGGQFEYLRVLQAQRAVAEARLERNKALGEAWKAAAELSGLLLEEVWPGLPGPAPQPRPEAK